MSGHVYYQACHGRWRCPLEIRITDSAALSASGMGWIDRMNLRMIASWPSWLGRFWLETTVAYDGSPSVVHTTQVRWLGVPMMKSIETIRLSDDGRTFTMEGEQRVLPAWWSLRTLSGTGHVVSDRASYAFDWLGVRLEQTTVREDDRVTVTQRGPGFEGVQRLKRC